MVGTSALVDNRVRGAGGGATRTEECKPTDRLDGFRDRGIALAINSIACGPLSHGRNMAAKCVRLEILLLEEARE
jgi:hypothetical protein